MLLKVCFTAAIVLLINVIGKRYPALGGYIAVLPVITFLSLITLSFDKQSNESVSTFLTGAMLGVALTSLTLFLMLLLVRGGLPLSYVVLLGMSLWAVVAFIGTQWVT